ncbi:hypothetical protein Neosp_002470 [[Neocosmospora] mangrovei]
MSFQFDPSIPKAGEGQVTMDKTEAEVSLAYSMALHELQIILKMIREVRLPPSDDLETLKTHRELVISDVTRLDKKVNISMEYLRARDAQFHCQAKRLRTPDRIDRLRLWYREKKHQMEASRLQHGDKGYQAALERFEEEKRVTIKCYELDGLWKKAMKREESVKSGGEDDLASDCETIIGED